MARRLHLVPEIRHADCSHGNTCEDLMSEPPLLSASPVWMPSSPFQPTLKLTIDILVILSHPESSSSHHTHAAMLSSLQVQKASSVSAFFVLVDTNRWSTFIGRGQVDWWPCSAQAPWQREQMKARCGSDLCTLNTLCLGLRSDEANPPLIRPVALQAAFFVSNRTLSGDLKSVNVFDWFDYRRLSKHIPRSLPLQGASANPSPAYGEAWL